MADVCAKCGDDINNRIYLLKGVKCSGAGCTVLVHRYHIREICNKKKWFNNIKTFTWLCNRCKNPPVVEAED